MRQITRRMLTWVVITSAAFSASTLAATLQDVSFSALPGNRAEIILTLDEPVAQPSSFVTDNPARIAIDLTGVASTVPKITPVAIGVARSVTAIEAKDRTRVVISLLSAVEHQITTQQNQVIIQVGASAGTGSLAADQPLPMVAAAERQVAANHTLRGVDFRRGPDGEGRIDVTLSDPKVLVDMRQQGADVILDFLDTELPPELARILDVTDFATPVSEIVTRPDGNHVRIQISTHGEFEHLAYQTDQTYSIEFRALSRAEIEQRRAQLQVYEGDRLSLNFQDIEVRSVLQLLADFTGLNMVVSDSVTGSITLRLKNVPWDQAMDIILKTKGLSQRRNDNVILIAPTEEIAAREKLELESQHQIEELAPLRSELIQVNYAKASDLAALLKSAENNLLSGRGNVTIDERTNSLLVQDTSAKLSEIRALLSELDVPVKQVLIESRIVIASNDFAKDLGVKFGADAQTTSVGGLGDRFVASGALPGDLTLAESANTGITVPAGNQGLLVNLPQTLASGSGGAVNFVLGKIGSHLLRLELSAMQQEGKGEIVSSPRVITSDQNRAVIKQGVEIPYQEASSSGATSVSFKEAVLQLEVTPHITPDGRVIMDLKVNKDSPDFARAVLGVPPVNTRELETSVLIENGETVVLGGVFESATSNQVASVPFFGDLPLLGALFRQRQTQDESSELLVFVTPKILNDSLNLR